MLLMATRKMSYRDAEDQIRYYAPARYLCGLTETDWTHAFPTIQDFTELMGEEGLGLINEYAVELAVAEKLADPKVISADTTAQEAAIPWPNEMGLMASFFSSVTAASKRGGHALKAFAERVSSKLKAAKEKVRKYRLFAKTKEMRLELLDDMANLVKSAPGPLGRTLRPGVGSLRGVRERAGHSQENVEEVKALGVKQVALAPRGQTKWAVSDKVRRRMVKERAEIEAGIGAVKSGRYGFHRPPARSMAMMGACGQRAVLGFNLNKLIRQIAARDDLVLAG